MNDPTAATLTVPQAAAILGISKWSYYEGVKNGQLPALKIGRRLIVPRVQLERLLEGDVRRNGAA
jgi:excisionase family DNA binding protein